MVDRRPPDDITKAKIIDHFYDIDGYYTEYADDIKDILAAIERGKQEIKDDEEKKRLERITKRPNKKPIAKPDEQKDEQQLPPEIKEKIERLERRVADLSLGDESKLPDHVYEWPRRVTDIKRRDLKSRQKFLKTVPKFEELIPEAVTRDPSKVTKKFKEKEAVTFVTKTLPKMYKQVTDIYRLVLYMHMQGTQSA